MGGNPIKRVDVDGKFWDAVIDIGFILYDVVDIAVDYIQTGKVDPIDAAALTADATALLVPGLTGGGLMVRAGKTTAKAVDKANDARKFGGKADTQSKTGREAFRKAKDQNGIPRSQQPDKTTKPNTPEGDNARLDSRNVKQYEFTNSKGKKITVRQDKAAKYNQQGKGDQNPHYNAGKKGHKLKQHHYYKDKKK